MGYSSQSAWILTTEGSEMHTLFCKRMRPSSPIVSSCCFIAVSESSVIISSLNSSGPAVGLSRNKETEVTNNSSSCYKWCNTAAHGVTDAVAQLYVVLQTTLCSCNTTQFLVCYHWSWFHAPTVLKYSLSGVSGNILVFYRLSSYASTVLAVIILSVCTSHACFVTKPNNAVQIFWYHTKLQSL